MCTICLDDSLLSPVMDLDYYLIRLNKELMNMTLAHICYSMCSMLVCVVL